MPKSLAALLVAVVAVSVHASEPLSDKPLYVEGRMLVLVPSAFPAEALAGGRSAKVEVTGAVRTDGLLEDIRIESIPPDEAFAAAVRKVAPLWRLQPRISSPGCGATDTQGRITIWFEIADGKPKVSYGTRPPGTTPAAEIHTDRKPVHVVAPLYPRSLAMDPNAPSAILQVAYVGVAEDGAVTGVTVAPMLHYREFEPLLAAAVRQWKYAPQARPWCAEARFHMTLD